MKTIAIIILAASLASCSKSETFPGGGDVDKAQENLEGNWELSKYLRNGTDETHLVLISSYTEDYSNTGVYARSYIKSDQTEISENGAYHLSDNMLEIRISDVSSISGFSDNNSTLSSSAYTIYRLTTDELIYRYVNGSDTHEFRFTVSVNVK